ncbi:DUF947-domain-containing protein [Tilletiopsis washingtonensis]|uniref:rRNA biogenesis protein RRP36 n=1 Tax=Tilletiopsis washingtonensis TaxID=58919 RepID=A0A316ZG48_9BASI|nr:DUF947-domain-containing protein [Tilletiopsis washingtonensis]PWO00217.1 DUF947-domain-containing protein [Tilletiopsis washingtonensis]
MPRPASHERARAGPSQPRQPAAPAPQADAAESSSEWGSQSSGGEFDDDDSDAESADGRDGGWGKVGSGSGSFANDRRRENKHAPMEMSSRKPVSRKRTVIETPAIKRRDPRFSSLSASAPNAGLFESSYGFLRQQQMAELSELRKTHRALTKQEKHHAGPKARSEQALQIQAEKARVEAALRRTEGLENERRKRERETEVLRRHKRDEEEKVAKGGQRFFLKDSAKRTLFLKDKYERLAGGNKAGAGASGAASSDTPAASSRKELRKSIERRRKKNAQKERRDMPAMGARESSGAAPLPVPQRKRAAAAGREGGEAPRPHKRGRRG